MTSHVREGPSSAWHHSSWLGKHGLRDAVPWASVLQDLSSPSPLGPGATKKLYPSGMPNSFGRGTDTHRCSLSTWAWRWPLAHPECLTASSTELGAGSQGASLCKGLGWEGGEPLSPGRQRTSPRLPLTNSFKETPQRVA